jgi:hypothetical protein
MDIVQLQREDHARLEQLILRYQGSAQGRADTFRDLVNLVTTHAFAEETVLFPACRTHLEEEGDRLTGQIEQEHQQVNELLVSLQGHSPGDQAFEEGAAQLFAILRHDARQEEDVLLAALAPTVDAKELESIGSAWSAARAVAPNRAHPRVSRRPPGNVLAAPMLTLIDHARDALARRRGRAQ